MNNVKTGIDKLDTSFVLLSLRPSSIADEACHETK